MLSESGEDTKNITDEDDDFQFLGSKSSFFSKCCKCISSGASTAYHSSNEKVKPCGLFGAKSFAEVEAEIFQKSEFKEAKGYGLLSLIVKCGDDLR